MTTANPAQETQFKLGKSPYWLTFSQEEFGLTSGWRVGIVHVPPRARKKRNGLPLLEVTPRKPILLIMLDDESYPLFVSEWEKKRGAFVLRGQRRMGSEGRVCTWSAEITPRNFYGSIQLNMDITIRVEPRPTTPVRIKFCLPLNMTEPIVATSEVATIREDRALVVWDAPTQNAVAFVPPCEALLTDMWTEKNEFVAFFTESVIAPKKTLKISLSIGQAKTGRQVKEILLEHYATTRPMLLPPEQVWGLTLCQTAAQAVISHTDKGAFEVRGAERAYFHAPGAFESGPPHVAEFFSGYPHFPVDASDALLDWHKFASSETVARIAKLTARGVASDFPNSLATGYGETNKGAFWDKQSLSGGPRAGTFTGFDDQLAFSILSNARIARALFDIYVASGEDLFATMALNACRWMLLRQNVGGYFGGDRYTLDGKWDGGNKLAGVEVIPAFCGAFRATKNEVFIRAAWRTANYVIDEMLAHHPAVPILPMERGASIDSAVGLASVIKSLLYLDAEAPNKRLREAIHSVGNRFVSFPFNRTRDPEFNYDEQWGGLYECAEAAFWLYNLERQPRQLQLAMSLMRSVPPCARRGWRAIPAYTTTMMTLAAQLKDAKVDLINSTIKVGWRLFEADSATRQYMQVESADEPALVDHLALVCKGDDTVLLMVLSDRPIHAVDIVKNGRRPVLRDLVTKELVSGPARLHTMAHHGQARCGLFTISK